MGNFEKQNHPEHEPKPETEEEKERRFKEYEMRAEELIDSLIHASDFEGVKKKPKPTDEELEELPETPEKEPGKEISAEEAEAFIKGVFADVRAIAQNNDFLSPEEIDNLYKSITGKNYAETSEILEEYAKNTSNEHLRDTALHVIERINGREFKECIEALRRGSE